MTTKLIDDRTFQLSEAQMIQYVVQGLIADGHGAELPDFGEAGDLAEITPERATIVHDVNRNITIRIKDVEAP